MQQLNEAKEYGGEVLDFLEKHSNTTVFSSRRTWLGKNLKLTSKDLFLYHIKEITFEEKAPRKEAVENILGTFRGLEGYNFIYMILGEKDHVDFYFGVAADKFFQTQNTFSAYEIAAEMLEPSIKGNFRGSMVKLVDADEKTAILERLQNAKRFGILEGVPGLTKESDSNNEGFQGVDRLIDVMLGERFGFVVIAHPCTFADTDQIRQDLYDVYDALMPLTKYNMQKSTVNMSSTVTSSSFSVGRQAGKSTQHSDGTTVTKTENTTHDERKDESHQIQASKSENESAQSNFSKRISKSESETDSSGNYDRHDSGQSSSEDVSDDKSKSASSGTSNSYSNSYAESVSTAHSNGANQSISDNKNKSCSENYSSNKSCGKSSNKATNTNYTEQLEVGSKNAAYWIEYIDKILLPRLDEGCGKGLFKTCIYLFSDDNRAALYRAGNSAISLFCGEKGNQNALSFYELNLKEHAECCNALKNFQIPAAKFDAEIDDRAASALSHCVNCNIVYCANWLASNEVSVVTGLPRKEVIGLSLRKEVDFGLNVTGNIDEDNKIEIGKLVQCGEEKNITFSLDKTNLDKHVFVAGVTGSGKTTTCQNILLDSELPFLVIEPAKTEYRVLKGICPELIVFTPGRQDIAPFYLNPFELIPGEAITSRADMLKATMEASFDMDAAIPQILEAAIYKAYEDKGWNIGDNSWNPPDYDEEVNPFADGVYAFPTLSDFVKATEDIVLSQGFDQRLKDDYLGSIRARLQGLLVGAKGMMLNNCRSVNFLDLLDKKVVIELEEIKNGTEKSLIMGFILTNLLEALKYKHRQDPGFQHITLVEEAHRLLSNYAPGDSMNKKQGVEVFADMLAEVRKYRESLIIVDQIPSKMTPEVLKNTSTKIVHKIFAQDDKDIIGNTMALEKEQKEFLSNLIPGRAVVFTQGLSKAIQVQVTAKTKTTGIPEVTPEEISVLAKQYYLDTYKRGVLRGLEHKEDVTLDDVTKYLHLQSSDLVLGYYRKIKSHMPLTKDEIKTFRKYVKKSIMASSEELFVLYFYWNLNKAFDEGLYSKYKQFFKELFNNEANLSNLWYVLIKKTNITI